MGSRSVAQITEWIRSVRRWRPIGESAHVLVLLGVEVAVWEVHSEAIEVELHFLPVGLSFSGALQ
jgi:hypothetical protein